MHVEAVRRMGLMCVHDETIRQFAEEGRISKSEPPFGAFYWVDSKELEEKKKHDAVKRVELIAEKLKQRLHVVDVVEGACAWLKSRVVYPWFRRYSMTDKKFIVDSDKCTHCGVCVKSCPMQNITQKAGEIPRWHGNCAMCLACIHRCPVRAIEYAKATQNKGRYYFKQS